MPGLDTASEKQKSVGCNAVALLPEITEVGQVGRLTEASPVCLDFHADLTRLTYFLSIPTNNSLFPPRRMTKIDAPPDSMRYFGNLR